MKRSKFYFLIGYIISVASLLLTILALSLGTLAVVAIFAENATMFIILMIATAISAVASIGLNGLEVKFLNLSTKETLRENQ